MYKRYVFLQYIENAGRSRKYSNHLGAIFFFLTGITMSSQLESYSQKSDSVKTGLLECSLSACQIYRPLNYLSTQSLCRNSIPLVTQATPWTMPSSPPLCSVWLVSPHLQPQLIRTGLASWPNQSLLALTHEVP